MTFRALDELNETGTLSKGLNNDGFMSILLRLCETMTAADWTALRAFYDIPYFDRSWIVQEIVSGTELRLLVGASEELHWELVSHASLWLGVARRLASAAARALDRTMPLPTNAAMLTYVRRTRVGAGLSLSRLPTFFHYQSRDPRDKIFSIAGIFDIPQSVQHHFVVDYSRATWLVHAEAVRGTIKATRKLGFLAFEDQLSCATANFPSWVPSLEGARIEHFRMAAYALNDRHSSLRKLPDASGASHAKVKDLEQRPEVLTVLGIRLPDGISHVFELQEATRAIWTFLLLRDLHAPFRSREFAVSFAEAITHRYIHGHYDRSTENIFLDFKTDLRRWIPNLPRDKNRDHLVADLDDWDSQDLAASTEGRLTFKGNGELYQSMVTETLMYEKRSLFVTATGRIAFGTCRAQVGDSIVVVLGGDMPFVMRPDSDRRHWKRVGMVWVPGIMDGEVLDDPRYKQKYYSLV